MIGFPLGVLYANALEWGVHRFILHGLGKKPSSFFAFHWHEHHRAARKHAMRDDAYAESPFAKFGAGSKEALSLLGLGLLHLPIAKKAPWFSLGILYSGLNYYRTHRRAHLDPDWAREHMPWHVDHHMAPDQDANWCVTRPWFDRVMGTRKAYVGTDREAADRARIESRKRRAHAASVASDRSDRSDAPDTQTRRPAA